MKQIEKGLDAFAKEAPTELCKALGLTPDKATLIKAEAFVRALQAMIDTTIAEAFTVFAAETKKEVDRARAKVNDERRPRKRKPSNEGSLRHHTAGGYSRRRAKGYAGTGTVQHR